MQKRIFVAAEVEAVESELVMTVAVVAFVVVIACLILDHENSLRQSPFLLDETEEVVLLHSRRPQLMFGYQQLIVDDVVAAASKRHLSLFDCVSGFGC